MAAAQGSHNPSALVISCTDLKTSKQLISDILDAPVLPEPVDIEENVEAYRWDLDTKYYNATVNLCTCKYRTVPGIEFADSVEAVILHFNPHSQDSFSTAKTWLTTINDIYAPAIKLLTCDQSAEDDLVPNQEVVAFCLSNQLELIQLKPLHVDSDDEEFGGIHGVGRVCSALKAHTWSNLTMKPSSLRRPVLEDSGSDSSGAEEAGGPTKDQLDGLAGRIASSEASQERGVDIFEQLFSRLHEFRATSATLTGEERKNYAEQVTKDFWKSLGEDPDELSDSDG